MEKYQGTLLKWGCSFEKVGNIFKIQFLRSDNHKEYVCTVFLTDKEFLPFAKKFCSFFDNCNPNSIEDRKYKIKIIMDDDMLVIIRLDNNSVFRWIGEKVG